MPYLADAVLIDTSAAIALLNPKESNYKIANKFYYSNTNLVWTSINSTAHESYTRARYDYNFICAIEIYNFLKGDNLYLINFDKRDEDNALSILKKYKKNALSFHDALCAAIMKKFGIYRIFTFDSDFYIFGFEVLPGYS